MCTYEAYKKAKKMFAENGYLNRVDGACELPDKWLFFSRHDENNIWEYGNCPISVDKQTGVPTWFHLFEAGTDHMKQYEESVVIPLPEEL